MSSLTSEEKLKLFVYSALFGSFVFVCTYFFGVPMRVTPERSDRELCERYCDSQDAVLVEIEADDLRGPVCHCAIPDYE